MTDDQRRDTRRDQGRDAESAASPPAGDARKPPDDGGRNAADGVTQPTRAGTPAPNASADTPSEAPVWRRDDAAGEDRDPSPPTPPTPDADRTDAPPGIPERPIPIGCHPFVFGVIAATIQLAITIYLMRSCSE